MIEIDILLGSKCVSLRNEEMNASVLIAAIAVLAYCGIVHGTMTQRIDGQLQLDDCGENT